MSPAPPPDGPRPAAADRARRRLLGRVGLSPAEQSYLDGLQGVLQTTLDDAVDGMEGVTVADLAPAMDGHRWCSEDPWVYGLSVYWTARALESQAPFHPTPVGPHPERVPSAGWGTRASATASTTDRRRV